MTRSVLFALLLLGACTPGAPEPIDARVAPEPGPEEPPENPLADPLESDPSVVREAPVPLPPVPAQPLADQGTFVLQQGENVVVTEEFARTPAELDATLAAPGRERVSYEANLTPEATVARMEMRVFSAGASPGAAPTQRAVATFQGDSVSAETMVGDSTRTDRVGTTPGAVPYINPSPSLIEQIVRRARVLGGERAQVPVFLVGSDGQTAQATVTFLPPDSATVTLAGTELRLRVDEVGRVLGGRVPAQNLLLERRPAAH